MGRGNLREARASPCPHGDEIAEALQHAQAIYDFVLQLVPQGGQARLSPEVIGRLA